VILVSCDHVFNCVRSFHITKFGFLLLAPPSLQKCDYFLNVCKTSWRGSPSQMTLKESGAARRTSATDFYDGVKNGWFTLVATLSIALSQLLRNYVPRKTSAILKILKSDLRNFRLTAQLCRTDKKNRPIDILSSTL